MANRPPFTTFLAKQEPKQTSSRNSSNSNSTTNGGDDHPQEATKRIPPIKAPVGLAKGPDLKNCKSKIGSLNNIKHTPAGGRVTIPSQKLNWEAKSKVGSLENKEHKPGGGNLKVETRKLEWKTSSKVESLKNIDHKPGGGNVKIFNDSYVDNLKKKSPTPKDCLTKEQSSSKDTNNNAISKTFNNLRLKD